MDGKSTRWRTKNNCCLHIIHSQNSQLMTHAIQFHIRLTSGLEVKNNRWLDFPHTPAMRKFWHTKPKWIIVLFCRISTIRLWRCLISCDTANVTINIVSQFQPLCRWREQNKLKKALGWIWQILSRQSTHTKQWHFSTEHGIHFAQPASGIFGFFCC